MNSTVLYGLVCLCVALVGAVIYFNYVLNIKPKSTKVSLPVNAGRSTKHKSMHDRTKPSYPRNNIRHMPRRNTSPGVDLDDLGPVRTAPHSSTGSHYKADCSSETSSSYSSSSSSSSYDSGSSSSSSSCDSGSSF